AADEGNFLGVLRQQTAFSVRDDLGFRTPGVRDQAAGGSGRGCFSNVLSDSLYGRANDNQLRLLHTFGNARADLGYAAASFCFFKRFTTPADSDDVCLHLSLAPR